MAALLCYEAQAKLGPVRPMHIISFENDLNPLRLAFRNNHEFTYLRHSAIGGILKDGSWHCDKYGGVRWTLLHGDFFERISEAPALPDIIFYDMFSSKTDGAPWTFAALQKLFAACQARPTELYTYTCSTPIRAGLLVTGFHVARGCGTVDKVDTTIALTPAAAALAHSEGRELAWLGDEWLAKWGRSSAKFPVDLPEQEQQTFEKTHRAHPQFTKEPRDPFAAMSH
jgi:queuine tRNA-ribosyltransferase